MEEQIGLVRLGKASSRMATRIDRWTRKLAAMEAPTAKAAAMKGAASIETAIVDGRREDPFDALALSIAHDKLHLGFEAERLPAGGGDFGSYHQEIMRLHQAIEMAGTEEEADALMARWAEIDRLALSGRPTMMALHTDQRQGDLLRLTWSGYDGSAIILKQSKTGARVCIPARRP